MATPLEFDSVRDTAFAHQDHHFDHVLHLFHLHWHGIRSACACLPGHKLAIPHEGDIDGEFLRHIFGLIFKHKITSICIQGVSGNAMKLAALIRAEFGSSLVIAGITHVNSSQFEYSFEIEMQRILVQSLRRGVFNRIASVKPHFSQVIDSYWPHTIYNCAPNISQFAAAASPDFRSVFIPLENTWRKNLYTNVIAACNSVEIDSVFTVNPPSHLGDITDISKVQVVGYLRTMNLYSFMATVGCVMNVSLAECQPMVQLEAMAMGTPCITGPLKLSELANHPLTVFTEVDSLDSPREIQIVIEKVLRQRLQDEIGFQQMITDYTSLRLQLCLDSYTRLLSQKSF